MKKRVGPRYILAPWADTENMTRATKSTAQRHHWLNTIVGILDAAFHLSEEEQFQVITVVRQVLEALRIPERGAAHSLPAPVALEIASAYYTVQLSHARNSGAVRPVRQAQAGDMVVSAEAWRDAIVGMISSAYPDLAPEERLFTAKVVADLLAALGVPYRAAAFFPDAVVRAYHASPEATASYLR
jgi:hypothetical protein